MYCSISQTLLDIRLFLQERQTKIIYLQLTRTYNHFFKQLCLQILLTQTFQIILTDKMAK